MRYLILVALLWRVSFALSSSENDFYTFPKSVSLKDGAQFDYIVVGAGAGGVPVATRLALAGHDVLLVEAGGNPDVLTRIPAAAMGLLGSRMDWQYNTLPNNVSCLSSAGQQCRFSRGKCLGGSTSINYMLYTRGNRRKDFEEIPFPGWTFDDLMPYYLRYEGLQDLAKLPPSSKQYHNTTGTMSVGFFDDPQNSLQSELINAYGSLQFPYNSDVNAYSQIGISKVLGYVYRGERMSTARGYLARKDVKSTLKITKHTVCMGVIIDSKVAVGVTVVKRSKKLKLFARKEVILSAGAIGTPQILMLSGVGPAQHLNSMGIPVNMDLPVGDRMTDHILPLLILQVPKPMTFISDLVLIVKTTSQLAELLVERRGALTSNGLTDINIFANSYCYDFERRRLMNESSNGSDCEVPNVQIIHAYIERNLLPLVKPLFKQSTGFEDNVIEQISKANEKYGLIVVSPILLEPRSVGTVRLASRDPLLPPAITPNYLIDDRDVEDIVRSINIVEDLVTSSTFKQQHASLLRLQLPGCPLPSDNRQQYWRCYVRHMTFAVYHAAGTAALGAVLDEQLRVRGVERLRVADLSALPRAPRANTASIAIALGERLAELIMENTRT